MQVSDGEPEPIGVSLTPEGVNVAVYSEHASAVEFCLFDAMGEVEQARIALPARLGPIFHGHIAGVGAGARYGLRAHGPFNPSLGHWFEPNKLLIDPYALELDRPFSLAPTLFPGAEGDTDSAPSVPKAIILPAATPGAPRRNWIAWDETVIYELHVKGFTKSCPDIPERLRGTFAGLAHPAAIRHLKRLGVTTVELLPCAAWMDERHLPPLGLVNYWGYNPVAFMAPDPRLAPGGWAEVRRAVDALAEAGIETLVDVVLNHSGEGDALGPTVSLRGLDNASYYRLSPENSGTYINDAGTGNVLALDHPAVLRLALDALRVWRRRGGVHGFRFDLASVLGRRVDGFDPAAPLLTAIGQDPELRALKLIAEPWDCGPGGYQLGRFPSAWGEWNDRFRDTIRSFWRGDAVSLGNLARRISGSEDIFARRRPSRSINFITAHDGFTLADLVTYSSKRNEANGEQNRDGTDDNRSWNHGVDGPTKDPDILTARLADQRALLATLIFARGTPMLSMGMESGQSQGGNNNAYAQDNATSWLDWAGAEQALIEVAAKLISLRRAHPALRADRFLTGAPKASGSYPDVAWTRADGQPMTAQDWDAPHGETLVMSLSAQDGDQLDRVVLAVHRGASPADLILPAPQDGAEWRLAFDSAAPARADTIQMSSVRAAPRSVVLFVERPTPRQKSCGIDDQLLDRLGALAGIAPTWWSVAGEAHTVSRQTKLALLAALNLPAATQQEGLASLHDFSEAHERRPLPNALHGDIGSPIWLELRNRFDGATPRILINVFGEQGFSARFSTASAAREPFERIGADGRRISGQRVQLPPLPIGRYRLIRDDAPDTPCALTVAPRQAYLPAWLKAGDRRFAITAQLYGLRRPGDQGLGDFTSLGDLAEAAGSQGAALVAINPLHALFFKQRDRASPYYPSDRRFLDPMYLDLAKVPFCEDCGPPPDALLKVDHIDYEAAWAFKAKALEQSYRGSRGAEAFKRVLASGDAALEQFAIFQALSKTLGHSSWRSWPEAFQKPTSSAAQAFAAEHRDEVEYHIYLQRLCEGQLAAAAGRAKAAGAAICRDLAIGAAPDGAEPWACQDLIAKGVSIGAPPDPLGPQGQIWGLPPFNPHRLAVTGYSAMTELFSANMRHAGALRVDHVLGLARQFWVPEGAQGADGAYVTFPLDALLAELKLESARAQCLIIGEDLGTVPEGLRERLADAACLSYRVLPFEREGSGFKRPEAYPRLALACAATHDLPPLAGWWQGVDIIERLKLGLMTDEQAQSAEAERTADRRALLEALVRAGFTPTEGLAATPELLAALHGFLASSPSALAALQLEDLAGETIGVNLPGTDKERPNWRRRLQKTLPEIMDSALARDILEQVKRVRLEP